MENKDFLNNIEDILYPENQKEIEELNELKKIEKAKRKEEHMKNHPDNFIEPTPEYIK